MRTFGLEVKHNRFPCIAKHSRNNAFLMLAGLQTTQQHSKKAEYFTSAPVQRALKFRERNVKRSCIVTVLASLNSTPTKCHTNEKDLWASFVLTCGRSEIDSEFSRLAGTVKIPVTACSSLGDNCDETSMLPNTFRMH